MILAPYFSETSFKRSWLMSLMKTTASSWGEHSNSAGNHQNVGSGNRFAQSTLFDFLTLTVTTPQTQLGWGISPKVWTTRFQIRKQTTILPRIHYYIWSMASKAAPASLTWLTINLFQIDPLQMSCPWTDAFSNQSNRDDQSVTSSTTPYITETGLHIPGLRDECPTPIKHSESPWDAYHIPASGYTYSSNSQMATPYMQQLTPMQPELQMTNPVS